MKKIISSILSFALLFTSLSTSVFADSTQKGHDLALALVQSENAETLWSQMSDSEKNTTKNFAKKAAAYINKLQKEKLSRDMLDSKISSLPDDLPLAVQVSMLQVSTEESLVPDVSSMLRSSNSYYADRTVQGTNIFGAKMWSLQHRIEWTSDGSWLTQASRSYTPQTHYIGWYYEKVIKDEQEYGVGWNIYESDVQVSFRFDVMGQPVQNPLPRLWLKGQADGTYLWSN